MVFLQRYHVSKPYRRQSYEAVVHGIEVCPTWKEEIRMSTAAFSGKGSLSRLFTFVSAEGRGSSGDSETAERRNNKY